MSTTLVPVGRVRNGQPAETELVTSYRDTGHGLPVLVISCDWSRRQSRFRTEDTYIVEEVPTSLGRGFVLHRSPEAIAKDGPEADDAYQVLVANPQDSCCTCKGFARFGYCKHTDALRGLLAGGHIDHPEAGRPAEPFTPEELAVAPF